jgi:hypothetical protein
MAWSGSGQFLLTIRDQWDPSALAIDLTAATIRCAIFDNTVTPNFDADTAYAVAPWNAGEAAAGGGYTTGGIALGSKTYTVITAGLLAFDAASIIGTITAGTFNARGLAIYCDSCAGNNLLAAIDLGGTYPIVSGAFDIDWDPLGIYGFQN